MQENMEKKNGIKENKDIDNLDVKEPKKKVNIKKIGIRIVEGLVVTGLTVGLGVVLYKNKELTKTILKQGEIIGQRDQQIGTMWKKIGSLASEATRKGSSLGGTALNNMKSVK